MSRKTSKSKIEKETGSVSESDECALCRKENECSNWLQCEVCDAWFHAICAGVKKEIFDACKQMDNLHWICEKCNPAATRTLKMMTKMYEKQENMEKDLECLQKEMTAVKVLAETTQKDSQSMCGR